MRYSQIIEESAPTFTQRFLNDVEWEMKHIDEDYYNRTMAEAFGEASGDWHDYDDLVGDPSFEGWKRDQWRKKLSTYVRNVLRHFRGRPVIRIYRMVDQSEEWLRKLSDGATLGVYWTDSVGSANRYVDSEVQNGLEVTLVADVGTDAIAWSQTVALQIMNDAESEIRLRHGAEMTLVEISVDGNRVRPDLIGHRFEA